MALLPGYGAPRDRGAARGVRREQLPAARAAFHRHLDRGDADGGGALALGPAEWRAVVGRDRWAADHVTADSGSEAHDARQRGAAQTAPGGRHEYPRLVVGGWGVCTWDLLV